MFKLIIKRFGKNFVFRQKKCVLIFRPKNHSLTIFIFVAFFNVFDQFSVFVHFIRFIVLQEVLNDLNRFGRVQSKNVFYDEVFNIKNG